MSTAYLFFIFPVFTDDDFQCAKLLIASLHYFRIKLDKLLRFFFTLLHNFSRTYHKLLRHFFLFLNASQHFRMLHKLSRMLHKLQNASQFLQNASQSLQNASQFFRKNEIFSEDFIIFSQFLYSLHNNSSTLCMLRMKKKMTRSELNILKRGTFLMIRVFKFKINNCVLDLEKTEHKIESFTDKRVLIIVIIINITNVSNDMLLATMGL